MENSRKGTNNLATAEILRRQIKTLAFNSAMKTSYPAIPIDDAFEELLARLEKVERK